MKKLEKMAIRRISELSALANHNLGGLAIEETNTKQPVLGHYARTDSPYYKQVTSLLNEVSEWTGSVIKNKGVKQ